MQPKNPIAGPELRNLVVALVLATLTMVGWQYFYERPRMEKLPPAAQAQPLKEAPAVVHRDIDTKQVVMRDAAPKVNIRTDRLHGSISLRGARIDDLTLAQYRETIDKDSPEVRLLSPTASELPFFVETGMLPAAHGQRVPDANTVWQADGTELTQDKPVTLSWSNGQGLRFEKKIALDDAYMFTVTTTVKNNSGAAVTLYPYGLISRAYDDNTKHVYFMHEGPLGVMNNVLSDISYKSLREDGAQKFEASKGWIAVTDKYWLTAIIPSNDTVFDATYNARNTARDNHTRYQADLRAQALEVPARSEVTNEVRIFAGAKEVKLLDAYRLQFNIPLFDRAVDFGSLYFLTKPIFFVLSYFYSLIGNFGIAIMLLTVCIKILLFPLASKSMTAMAQMKILTPKMKELRERHGHDKMKLNQEMMNLYKSEKVNPMSGCLPILLQIPVFFALYRVLYTTLEMRHAPFFGWVHDLSAPDPTTVFNLFGLLPYDPTAVLPHFLHIGVWPLIMCATMVIQQRLNPKPADEIQAAVMNWMPFIFLFMFSGFAVGLVIYWAWNNVLSILQQLYINSRLKKKGLK
jgi:YidC/Oxa1 family membrane protein insertase